MKQHVLLAAVTLSLLSACGGSDSNSAAGSLSDLDKISHNAPRAPGLSGQEYTLPAEYSWNDPWGDYDNIEWWRGGRSLVKAVVGKRFVVDTQNLPEDLVETDDLIVVATPTKAKGGDVLSSVTKMRSYKGFYAGALILDPVHKIPALDTQKGLNLVYLDATPYDKLPKQGKVTYQGPAFNRSMTEDSKLNYTIDFGSRKGSGEISAAGNHGRMTLQEASIVKHDKFGVPSYGVSNGFVEIANPQPNPYGFSSYDLSIAGPQAEEVIGQVHYGVDNNDGIFFHGTRNDLQQ